MVSAIDMGLDDIIKSNKKAKKTLASARGGRGRGGNRRGRGGNRANTAANRSNNRNNQGIRKTRGGGVGQRRGNRGI